MPTIVSALGFPRIGPRRELKNELESYWAGKSDAETLLGKAEGLRAATWARQKSLGVTHIPSNDFSLYDHVLDTTVMVGAIPAAYGWTGGGVTLDTYFAMARGSQPDADDGHGHSHGEHGDLAALEMTKWFDTNYHYMVPELEPDQAFQLASTKPIDEFLEAKALGYQTRPVLLGPVTYLLLAKSKQKGFDTLTLLDRLLPIYAEVLKRLHAAGAEWVQIDEPALVLDLSAEARKAFIRAYDVLAGAAPSPKLLLTTYFGALDDNLDTALSLPVAGLHIDLVRASGQLDSVLAKARPDLVLSLGVVDGRNIWRADLSALLDRLEPVVVSGRQIMLAPSCSLLHAPADLALETDLEPEVRNWLAFAVQKLEELSTLARALDHGRNSVANELNASAKAVASRRTSPRTNNSAVRDRIAQVTATMATRGKPFAARRELQRTRLNLPAFPTTTIGSFPQTADVRKARAAHAKGVLSDAEYDDFLRKETEAAIRWQEEIGLDVLVHGEFERNDMVQYFGEQLAGFAFTKHAWVQSYGSRCVRPPIIFGDVSRPKPMTVDWWRYAQSLTDKLVKGMLTGPVTILQWSFVRDDLPRNETCRQIALALREEVIDLEAAGARIIQIDEAALREGLPLRRADWQHYLDWAVECFRLTSSGVHAETQIHTHMCYSEFNDIIAAIGAMDADVISIETARSRVELLDAFVTYAYPNEIGPGVYDIHSPRVPSVQEMSDLLEAARQRLSAEKIWVNPDCGLKTRHWKEVRLALRNMVQAAEQQRARSGSSAIEASAMAD
jgi:5-methyltetrahydropteroyltriglutamate--homocysteine methyltransferase